MNPCNPCGKKYIPTAPANPCANPCAMKQPQGIPVYSIESDDNLIDVNDWCPTKIRLSASARLTRAIKKIEALPEKVEEAVKLKDFESVRTSVSEIKTIIDTLNNRFEEVNTKVNEKATALDALTTKLEELKTLLDTKANKEDGKGLSSNDFTNELKAKLEAIDTATLATKEELATLATKEELATLATKEELATLATKEELATLATKAELTEKLDTKVDKEDGKGLSANDFTTELKTKLENIDTATLATKEELATKVDKVAGKELSSNDFTNELKAKLEGLNLDPLATKEQLQAEIAKVVAGLKLHGPYADVNEATDKNERSLYLEGTTAPYKLYIYRDNTFQQVGSTDVDLTGYATKEELTTKIQEANDRLDDLESDINVHSTEIDNLKAKDKSDTAVVSNLKTRVDTLQTNIDNAGKVNSVNGISLRDIVLTAGDINTSGNTTVQTELDKFNLIANKVVDIDRVTSVGSSRQVVNSINGQTGSVSLTGSDLAYKNETGASTIESEIDNIKTRLNNTVSPQPTKSDIKTISLGYGYQLYVYKVGRLVYYWNAGQIANVGSTGARGEKIPEKYLPLGNQSIPGQAINSQRDVGGFTYTLTEDGAIGYRGATGHNEYHIGGGAYLAKNDL